MKPSIAICIFLSLALISGLAEAQQNFGTKVKSGDSDVGLPLSPFAPIGGFAQNGYWVSYWDLNANGLYDDQDVAYLQFGSTNIPPAQRIVRANNIRLTGWGPYPAGSYVKGSDSDMGQQLNTVPPAAFALPSAAPAGFYYLDVAGSAGYDIGDPVYLKALSPSTTLTLGTNDIRITGYDVFPAGSRVSITDPDAGKTLTQFTTPVGANGGPRLTGPFPTPIATLMFYNANGDIAQSPPNPVGSAIFDDGDLVYFHVGAGGATPAVGPNDIRLYD